jgi:hypothetical protein
VSSGQLPGCLQVTISCLINQISDLPPEERRIPLATIAARTKLSTDGVEFLLMKALALHLIEGSIDQVRRCSKPGAQGDCSMFGILGRAACLVLSCACTAQLNWRWGQWD